MGHECKSHNNNIFHETIMEIKHFEANYFQESIAFWNVLATKKRILFHKYSCYILFSQTIDFVDLDWLLETLKAF